MFALVGAGEYLSTMEPVDRALLAKVSAKKVSTKMDKEEPVRVACLPTAAGTEGPQRINYWANLGVEHFARLGAQAVSVPVIDRESANNEALAEQVAQADIVYLSGGKPGYLYDSLAGSPTWAAIEAVLAKGGLLAGCSAGAMVQGERIMSFGGGGSPGFGLLADALIIPHFDEFPGMMARPMRMFTTSELTIVGIDGGTALFHDGNGFQVLGRGGVTIWNKGGKDRFTEGAVPEGFLKAGSLGST